MTKSRQNAAEAELEGFYENAARLIGAGRDEIAFLENATRAWDMAFYGIEFARGDRILTSSVEYGSNFLAYLQVARKRGVEVIVVPDDKSGQIDVAARGAIVAGGGLLEEVPGHAASAFDRTRVGHGDRHHDVTGRHAHAPHTRVTVRRVDRDLDGVHDARSTSIASPKDRNR